MSSLCSVDVVMTIRFILEAKSKHDPLSYFRVGHHSTSDDSSAYRSLDEVKQWNDLDSPISRLRQYLELKGWWDDAKERSLKEEARKMVNINSLAFFKYDICPSPRLCIRSSHTDGTRYVCVLKILCNCWPYFVMHNVNHNSFCWL